MRQYLDGQDAARCDALGGCPQRLTSGFVEYVWTNSEGADLVIEVSAAPVVLGALDAMCSASTSFRVRSLGPITVEPLHEDAPSRVDLLEAALAQERQLMRKALALLQAPAGHRLVALLATYAAAGGRQGEDGWTRLVVPRTQLDLANACGLTLRHTHRLLRRLAAGGAFRQRKGWLLVRTAALTPETAALISAARSSERSSSQNHEAATVSMEQ